MAAIKSYTDLEQSKKLAEILPLESADMYYAGHQSIINPKEWEYGDTPNIRGKYISFDDKRIFYPCWSFAALLKALPLEVEIHKQTDGHKIYYYVESYMKRMEKGTYLSTERYENSVDACVAMIEKLNELKIL